MTLAITASAPAGAHAHRDKLARLAGEIADFFKSYPEEEAASAIADHINQFWSRRMRADFLAAFRSEPGQLSPLLQRALSKVKPADGS